MGKDGPIYWKPHVAARARIARARIDCDSRMVPHRPFPFRWALPFSQLLLCLVILWPVRQFLRFELIQSIHSYSGTTQSADTSNSEKINVIVPPPTSKALQRGESSLTRWERRKVVPLALNFPVLIVQLPYIILSPNKTEWVPKGMFFDAWRAMSWPFAGMFFWFFLGRGFEALSAARQSKVYPRISGIETSLALILFVIGVVILIGVLTSTPDDRSDTQFMALIAGGVLWGILALAPIVARFLQWRLAKRTTAAESCGNRRS